MKHQVAFFFSEPGGYLAHALTLRALELALARLPYLFLEHTVPGDHDQIRSLLNARLGLHLIHDRNDPVQPETGLVFRIKNML